MLQEVAMSHDQKAVFKKSKLILKISTLQKLLKNHIKYLKLYWNLKSWLTKADYCTGTFWKQGLNFKQHIFNRATFSQ